MTQDDIRALNELKILSIDMITRANHGSPGLVLSMAPIVYTLFQRHLCIRPNETNWINRDRLVLSTGKVSSLIYAALYMAGFDIKKEDLMNYCNINSITPGFLERGLTPGVEVTSGLYGEGVATAIGIALSRRYEQALITQEDDRIKLLDYDTYCLCSDRDLMEGVTNEALSFAGAQKLDHCIIICNVTNITEDGPLSSIMEEEYLKKYQAMGLYVDYLRDGSNIKDIDKAINAAKKSGKTALLFVKNILGKDSLNENQSITYNKALTVDDVANLRKKWNLFLPAFEISKDSIIFMQKCINERTEKKYQKWTEMMNRSKSIVNEKIHEIIWAIENNQTKIDFDSNHYKINDGYRESLRESNLKVLNLIANKTNLFVGGSADYASSCQTFITNSTTHTAKNLTGRNISFGMREHAMASILNGMSLNGLRVYGSTKLVHADYLKPALRMTALMNLPVTYIFTHDTISAGEEGPATQPIEQLAMLHTTPNLVVYRPADIQEVMGAWGVILKNNIPAALVISQNDLPKLPGSNAKLVEKGAYVIKPENGTLDGILISSGSELIYALQIAYELEKIGIHIRVVSMPSLELFLGCGKDYEMELLPTNATKIVIEAGSPHIWNRFATSNEHIIGLNDYGFSGHPNDVLLKMGFDYESLKAKVTSLIKK